MSFIASVVNRHGYAHAFCKSSHGHYYMGARKGTEVVFKSVDEFNRFVEHLKSFPANELLSQYDVDVFGLVTGRVQFDLAPPTDDKARSITNKF